jgi:ribonuclease VapC
LLGIADRAAALSNGPASTTPNCSTTSAAFEMIVDTSALVAILYRKAEAQAFVERIRDADVCRINVADTVELSMVVENRLGPDGARQAETFLRHAVVVEPVTIEHGALARQAFLDFGKVRQQGGPELRQLFFLCARQGARESPPLQGRRFRPNRHPIRMRVLSRSANQPPGSLGVAWRRVRVDRPRLPP